MQFIEIILAPKWITYQGDKALIQTLKKCFKIGNKNTRKKERKEKERREEKKKEKERKGKRKKERGRKDGQRI